MTKGVQETGSQLQREIGHILTSILHHLDDDEKFVQFFEAIPSFCIWGVVQRPELVLAGLDKEMAGAFHLFLRRTFLSNSISEAEKKRRIIICVKAADAAELSSAALTILRDVFIYGEDMVLRSVEIGRTLARGRGVGYPRLCSQGIIAGIIASVPERDDRWKTLAMEQLAGVSEEVLGDYLAHGDSVLLASFTHTTRWLFYTCLKDIQRMTYELNWILPYFSKFDIRNSLPELQHDFCDLWNQITREARDRESTAISYFILGQIQHLYIALHPGDYIADTLNDPFSYPFCNVSNHRSHTEITPWRFPTIAPLTSSIVPPPDATLENNIPCSVSDGSHTIKASYSNPPADVESHPCPTTTFDLIDTPVISSNPPASTSVPQLAFAVPLQFSVGLGVSPPSTLDSSDTPPASRIEQETPDPGLVPSTSATTLSLTTPRQLPSECS
jgi:hypothetical protein